MSLLGSTKQQSRLVRSQIAFWCALAFTAFIGLIWLVSLPARYAEVESDIVEEVEQPAAVIEASEPQAASAGMFGDLQKGFTDVVEQFKQTPAAPTESPSEETGSQFELTTAEGNTITSTGGSTNDTEVQPYEVATKTVSTSTAKAGRRILIGTTTSAESD